MASIKQGDSVRIVTREVTADDVKNSTYFQHFGGLTGAVQKVYESGEVVVEIEPESLTKEVRTRHTSIRDQMKTKWLEGLSEEGRGKLTEREKDFLLRYTVLVPLADLEKVAATPRPTPPTDEPAPPRKTLAEIEAAEAEELRRHTHPSN